MAPTWESQPGSEESAPMAASKSTSATAEPYSPRRRDLTRDPFGRVVLRNHRLDPIGSFMLL